MNEQSIIELMESSKSEMEWNANCDYVHLYTPEQVHAYHPCGWGGDDDGKNWTLERIKRRVFKGRPTVSRLDVLDEPDLTDAEKLWLVPRPYDPVVECWLFDYVIQRAVRRIPDTSVIVDFRDNWLSGEDRSVESADLAGVAADAAGEVVAAWAAGAAKAAAVAAILAKAESAAVAAWETGWAVRAVEIRAVRAAVQDAVAGAAMAAVRDAGAAVAAGWEARSAERAQQIEDMRTVLAA